MLPIHNAIMPGVVTIYEYTRSTSRGHGPLSFCVYRSQAETNVESCERSFIATLSSLFSPMACGEQIPACLVFMVYVCRPACRKAIALGSENNGVLALVFRSLWEVGVPLQASFFYKNSNATCFLFVRLIQKRNANCCPNVACPPLHYKIFGPLPAKWTNGLIPKKRIPLKLQIPALFNILWSKYLFDCSCGYPGEGPRRWSSKEPQLKFATWNSRSMTQERFQYCKSLNYDVLAITELWRSAEKFASGTCQWTYSIAGINEKGKSKFPEDRAAGVGILLSTRAMHKYLAHGSPCERITWVRLKGPVADIFIIAIYLPHRMRTNPSQSDTAAALSSLLAKVPNQE